ncbi:transcriptional regulator of acetoin/glycerol metabolism [Nakamurella sp. UYEF19]|uniref:sigma-54-dependent Fis family transcriptional regulator n=1 Tax=Nakamurella sp. UYEF19 TaxID=1756392 RepID=UPI0033964057
MTPLPRARTTPQPRPLRLAVARENFLTAGPVDELSVRAPILTSWQRSRAFRVLADRPDLRYVKDPNPHSPLMLSSEPILRQLHEQLTDSAVSIVLTDANGLVLDRRSSRGQLSRHLDQVNLAPGFSYAENLVGTNGVGTTLESGTPTLVSGHEHYAENLERLTCAGAPIHHPVSGALLGAIDLTTWAKEPGSLLMTLAVTTASSIERNMLTQASQGEMALFRDYMSACQHAGGVVVAISDELVMMNDQARQTLNSSDQAALLARAADARGLDRAITLVAELPSGLTSRMHYQPAFLDDRLVGGVLRVQFSSTSAAPDSSDHNLVALSLALPGLVGHSASWSRCCRSIDNWYRHREWVAVEGEAGVGKLALARAVHQQHHPTGRITVLDAADSADIEGWLDEVSDALSEEDGGAVILRHVDQLGPAGLMGLTDLLAAAAALADQPGHPWVAITMAADRVGTEVDAQLLPHFPHSLQLPPLRHRLDDLHLLIPHLLNRITGLQKSLSCSPEAMRQLGKLPWLGNVAELREVLQKVVKLRRSGSITVEDLPAQCRSGSRRQLSPLENLERDAIVASLIANNGNKERAAQEVGMSRASIYRKIRDYGIHVQLSPRDASRS